ncbi:MAG: hypothetical protein Q7W02_02235 [Candidatus Rokubacteria bacterium]|nr:hypothetical protein [Candidatus Rokubacteria bacterium]
MSRLLPASALAALLIVCAAPRTGAGSAEPAGATGADSPAHCTNYSTGSDTHTACAPPASAPQGSTVACHNYTVGSDTHTECAPVPAPRLGAPREKKGGLVPPSASALRCYTYHIGSSPYTDCR